MKNKMKKSYLGWIALLNLVLISEVSAGGGSGSGGGYVPPLFYGYFISQTVPAVVDVCQSFQATVKMYNGGSTTWTEATTDRLATINSNNNTTWGSNRMTIQGGASVAYGAEYSFTSTFTAPCTPGTYNFQWQMIREDGTGLHGGPSANVAIEVKPLPIANAASVSVTYNTPKVLTLTGSGQVGDTLTYTVVTNPAHGALSGSAPSLVYTPTNGYSGADSFTFKVNDGRADSTAATITLSVSAPNQAPVASNQNVSVDYQTAKAITLSATDAESDPLSYSVIAFPSHGALSGTVPNLTYTPTAGYSGADSFTFRANDGTNNSNTATISIVVGAAPNVAPVAANQTVSVNYQTARSVTLSATDANGDALTYSVINSPSNGVLSGSAPNLTYTPSNGFSGSDSFTFIANDGTVDSNTATVTLNVNGSPALGITVPTAVTLATSANGIFAGGPSGSANTCALLADDSFYCWGDNSSGQCGQNGGSPSSAIPGAVTGISDITGAAASGNHSCVIVGRRTIKCFGNNSHGQLGDGTNGSTDTPTKVLGLF